jgi:predicted  nucleic acid-binding Zn-ribbon protein
MTDPIPPNETPMQIVSRLTREIVDLRARLAEVERERDEARDAWDDSYQDLREVIDLREAEIARQHKTLGEIAEWSHTFGAALNPPGANTYGEGKRDAKDEVAAILRRMG